MADNLAITPGSGATVAADEIGGVLYQRNKLIHGVNGTNDGDVSRANGFPVQHAVPASKAGVVTKAYSVFTGSFADLSITGVSGKTRMHVWNDTDGILALSEDAGTTTHEVVPPKADGYIDLLVGTTAIYGKYLSAPTAGNVYFRPEA